MIQRLSLTLALVALATAPAAASEACDGTPATAGGPAAGFKALFAYDTSAALAVQVVGSQTVGDALLQDVTFVSRPDRPTERLAAYIVKPAKPAASMAGILWVHWLGDPKTTNRTQYLEEAQALAGRGVVSVLVDAMWAKPRWYRDRVLEDDYRSSISQVVSLRRSLDVLLAQAGVDRARVALVGHDYGAMYGAIVAGVDGRAKAHVLIAPTASLLDWAFFYDKKPVSMDAYRREHEALSLCGHLATAGQISFFFQFAEKDEYVPLARAEALLGPPTGVKQMAVYGGAAHEMIAPAAIRADRTAWLVRELGLEKSSARSARCAASACGEAD